MIAVVDYGASNVKSVLRAFQAVGAVAELTDAPDAVRRAARVVVPGVGHFAPARRRLDETGLGGALDEVARAGRPLLGICLGLQLLFDESEEAPFQRTFCIRIFILSRAQRGISGGAATQRTIAAAPPMIPRCARMN